MAADLILDAGHGGFDNGASYMGRAEKDDVLRLTLAVGKILQEDGYNVYYTRTDDIYHSPSEKAALANQSGGKYFISFHRNSGVEDNLYRGVQSLVFRQNETVNRIAENIHAQLAEIGFKDLGIEEVPDLIILRETEMPAVLVEVGFLNHDADNRLFDEKFDQIAEAIAAGIEESIPITAQSMPEKYYVQTGVFKYDVNAAYQLERLNMQGFEGKISSEEPYYTVRAGGAGSLDEAVDLQKKLRQHGYTTLIVSEP
ncbi:MAG: N-acetylmuramoyl-L-alanine amidase [Clostridiales bacterium]|nr:N-acetylmuramoyl-L-alanine amidase [Clostridiales bacterium]